MTATIPETELDEVETNGLIIRPPSDETLAQVLEAWTTTNSTANVHIDRVNVNLEDDEPTIQFGEHEVPSTEIGLEALARFLEVPVRYLLAVPPDEQQFMLSHRIQRHGNDRLVVEYNSDGIQTIVKDGKTIITPGQIASTVASVMPIESPVRDFWANPNDLRIDTYFPLDWDGPEVGGDPSVGDLTQGGVRVFQNRKQNLAPGVRSYTYRLVCTNGMEVKHEGISLDARGKDEHEVLDALGVAIRETVNQLESDIQHFYDMRNQRITGDVTGAFRRLAQDAGISDRIVGRMEDRLAGTIGDEATEFDFANIITNYANGSPESAMARTLQAAGGSMVSNHTNRCRACHKRL